MRLKSEPRSAPPYSTQAYSRVNPNSPVRGQESELDRTTPTVLTRTVYGILLAALLLGIAASVWLIGTFLCALVAAHPTPFLVGALVLCGGIAWVLTSDSGRF